MASTQTFPGNFSSQLHQLNGNHFHGPVSISSPGQNDRRNSTSAQTHLKGNWSHDDAYEGSKSGLSEGLSWDDCLQSLAFEELSDRERVIDRQLDGTCEWLLGSFAYSRWTEEHGLLLIRGKPGCGKSTLLKFALGKQVEDAAASTGSLVLSFFFYASGTELQNSIEGLFRALLVQLLDQDVISKSTFQEICRKRWIAVGKKKNKHLTWYLSELQANFEKLVLECSARRKTTIFVDAIDECKDEDRDCLIRCFHILKDGQIDADFQLRLEEESQIDIQSYIEEELRLPDETQVATEGLKHVLKQKADGVFLWLRLIIRQIHELSSKGLNLKTIQSQILESPRQLDGLYRDLLEKINDGEVLEAGKLFQWICFTARPLSLDELKTAMTVHLSGAKGSLEEYEDENNPNYILNEQQMKKRMIHLSRGLLDIAMSKSAEGKAIVGFYHETIKNFMLREGLQYLSSRQKESPCLAETAQFQLANTCLQYLSTREIYIAFSGKQRSFPKEFHFLSYAAAYWLSHAVDAEKGGWGENVAWPSQMMLNTWVNIHRTPSFASLQCPNEGTTLMHIAAEHGLERLAKSICVEDIAIATLSETRSKSNHISAPITRKSTKSIVKNNQERRIDGVRMVIRENQQRSPKNGCGMRISHRLTRKSTQLTEKSDYRDQGSQAQGGKRAKIGLAADVLKERSFMINAKDSSGQLPMHSAAGNNHLGMTKFLHEHGSDLNVADQKGCTPLYKAVFNGHLQVVEFFYRNEAAESIHTATNNGWTPLNAASLNGHLEVVKFLYEHGADADIHTVSNDGWTSLNTASSDGHLEVVKFLYEHGADADIHIVSNNGWTPLNTASSDGHLKVVKFLYKHGADADIHTATNDGQTPLYTASRNGHLKVVQFLCEHGADADIHTASNKGWTPLNAASRNGHLEVVQFLYKHGADADIHTATNNGWTPLNTASSDGHLEVVKFLYEHGADADIHTVSNDGWTSLNTASSDGHLEVVKFLYEHGADADIHTASNKGWTPLHAASLNGHLEVVKVLKPIEDRPEFQDECGRTPLFFAAARGHTEVVQLLLLRNSLANAKDRYSTTPLCAAVRNGHEEVVRVLIPLAETTTDFEDGLGRNLLSWATRSGRTMMIEVVHQWAQRTGIEICQNDLKVESLMTRSDQNSRWCDVCTRYISSKSPFHSCNICHDFDICLECFGIGVQCFDVSHGWTLRHTDITA